MVDDLEKTETEADGDTKPKKRKKLIIPWKSIALYILPAIVVFIMFILMHNFLVQPPLSREEIVALINDKNEDENSKGNSDDEIDTAENTQEAIQQGSDIPFIGPQHFYHSFTGALATDLKNGSGILTIEISVSIFMGKLNAETYLENFKQFEPALRSPILALMRTKTKEQLETNQGKETLQLEILKTINDELVRLGAKPEIKAVQLTQLLLI
jgi:flagellar basal body-associated protein FliL